MQFVGKKGIALFVALVSLANRNWVWFWLVDRTPVSGASCREAGGESVRARHDNGRSLQAIRRPKRIHKQ